MNDCALGHTQTLPFGQTVSDQMMRRFVLYCTRRRELPAVRCLLQGIVSLVQLCWGTDHLISQAGWADVTLRAVLSMLTRSQQQSKLAQLAPAAFTALLSAGGSRLLQTSGCAPKTAA